MTAAHPFSLNVCRPCARSGAVALFVLGLIVPAAVAEPEVRGTHDSWTIVCDTPEQAEQEVCLMVQQKNLKDTDQPVLRVEIGYAVQTAKPFAVITVPLGISLPPGLSMRIDDGAVTKLEFGSCIPSGCVVGVTLTDVQVSAFKRGGEITFTFQDNRRRDISVPISLWGFTAALDAVRPSAGP